MLGREIRRIDTETSLESGESIHLKGMPVDSYIKNDENGIPTVYNSNGKCVNQDISLSVDNLLFQRVFLFIH